MPKAAAGEMIVRHLDDESRLHGLPFGRSLGRPTAGPAANAVFQRAADGDQRPRFYNIDDVKLEMIVLDDNFSAAAA